MFMTNNFLEAVNHIRTQIGHNDFAPPVTAQTLLNDEVIAMSGRPVKGLVRYMAGPFTNQTGARMVEELYGAYGVEAKKISRSSGFCVVSFLLEQQ